MKFVIKKENELSKRERKELHELLDNLLTWSIHVKKYLYWSSKPRWRIILYDNSGMIGSLSIVERGLVKNGKKFSIAGIGNVGIKKEFQGKGYAQEMLRFTEKKLAKENFNIALLFCDEKRTKLYEKVGYVQVHKPVTYYSKTVLKKEPIAMLLPLILTTKELELIQKSGLHVGRGTW